jgi:hypothetical protein
MTAARSPANRAALLCALSLSVACSSDDTPGNETYSREKLLDPKTCGECHPKHYEEWSGSMHAYASTDPVFRAMNQRGQEETEGKLDKFCVNCHAPLAVQEGATTDGLDLDSVPEKLQGVTCYFCHQVNEIEDVHPSNNPLRLANDVTMRGSLKDPVKSSAHNSAYSPFLDNTQLHDSSKMCGACHDIVLPGHFSNAPEDVPLEQTYQEWLSSAFAQPGISRMSCGDCHVAADGNGPQPIAEPPDSSVTMPQREVRHQHRFFAIDTALTDFPDKAEQALLVQKGIDASLLAELCVEEGFGNVTVNLENLLGGHNFPSGASHDRRMWAELHIYDTSGEERFQVGVVPPGGRIADEVDAGKPGLWFWDRALKSDGTTVAHMFWDVAEVKRDRPFGSIPGSQPGLDGAGKNRTTRTISGVTTGVTRPGRLTLSVWLEPVGLDVLDDLRETNHLKDDSVRNAMPRYFVNPERLKDPDADVSPILLEWDRTKPPEDFVFIGSNRCVTTVRP